MKRWMVGLAAVVGALTFGGTAWAETILFDNGAAIENGPTLRFNYLEWSTFDDFVLTEDSIVTGFRWTQFDEEQTAYASTTLLLFAGVPKPSTLIASINTVATRTANGMVIDVPTYVPFTTSDELLGFDYGVSGQSIALSAGTYFLGIHNYVSGGVTLIANSLGGENSVNGFYQGTRFGNDPPVFGLTESGPCEWNSGYTAFSVEGSAVPEPSSFLLFSGLGVMGLIAAWRRRKRPTKEGSVP